MDTAWRSPKTVPLKCMFIFLRPTLWLGHWRSLTPCNVHYLSFWLLSLSCQSILAPFIGSPPLASILIEFIGLKLYIPSYIAVSKVDYHLRRRAWEKSMSELYVVRPHLCKPLQLILTFCAMLCIVMGSTFTLYALSSA